MHDLKNLRKNINIYKKKFKDRNIDFDISDFNAKDTLNRNLISNKEKLEQEKKSLSKSKNESNFLKSKKISEEISKISKKQIESQNNLDKTIYLLPNLALDDVPIGIDDKFNKLIKKSGEVKEFAFTSKSHVELGGKDNSIDFEASIKLSGSRFVVLKDKIALLERALINFMLDTHTNEFQYTEISPPLIVNEDVMFGTGQLPKFEEDQFEIKFEKSDQRKFLIPTAEVVLTNLVRQSIIEEDHLPKRFVASTPCFRKEAGSYGKDTKGMIRQHQFYKVELVSIVAPDKCEEELERMLNCAEKIYDIEAWIPSEKKYREISSCSSCGTFQARRMNTKFKSKNGKEFVGTLNGSGLAVGRLMIALLENNQNKDGTINIPNVLKKYMNNLEKI